MESYILDSRIPPESICPGELIRECYKGNVVVFVLMHKHGFTGFETVSRSYK